jgi:hypothetical protein
MNDGSDLHPPDIWKTARKYPRLSLTLPVELQVGETKIATNTLNLSAGGMLLQPQRKPLALGTEVQLQFSLPTGHAIAARAKVVHVTTTAKVVHLMGSAIGLQFIEVDEAARLALSQFLRRMITYVRRGVRVKRQMHVTVRRTAAPESAIETADTIVISRHGGLLSPHATFKANEEIFLWWPDGKRGTTARVVHRRHTGIPGLLEMGFEFLQNINFWGLDFPQETEL